MAESETVTLKRYPRSLSESPNFVPDWRALQAKQYLALYNKSKQEREVNPAIPEFTLPDWENDHMVVEYYAFLRYGTTGDPAVDDRYFYAHECSITREYMGAGVHVKAYMITGLDLDGIAERMGTTPDKIATFLLLYFDVESCLANKDYMSRLAFAFVRGRTEDPFRNRERSFYAKALHFGLKGLEAAIYGTMDMADCDREELYKRLNNTMLQQAMDFMIVRRSGGYATSDDFDRFVNLEAVSQSRQGSNVDVNAFAPGIAAAGLRKRSSHTAAISRSRQSHSDSVSGTKRVLETYKNMRQGRSNNGFSGLGNKKPVNPRKNSVLFSGQ